jgi:hypothetical protein
MILKVKEKVKSNFSKYLKAYLKRLCKDINNILSEVQETCCILVNYLQITVEAALCDY